MSEPKAPEGKDTEATSGKESPVRDTTPAGAPTPAGAFSPRPIFIEKGDFEVTLPGGFLIGDKINRQVTLRPVTAGDRRTFGDKKYRKNTGLAITKLLANKVTAIEGVASLKESHIRQLLSFDRDFLVFALRENLNPGRAFKEKFICEEGLCRAENDLSMEPSELELREMPDEVRTNIDASKQIIFDVEVPEFGFTGVFRYSHGTDQEYLGRISDDSNPFDLEFELISRICVDFMGKGPVDVELLAKADPDFITALQDCIRDRGYGFDIPQAECYKCGLAQDVQVNPLDFLFGTHKKKSKARRAKRKS